MELKAKIIGVESASEGVVIVVQQEKMKIPLADDNSDEAIFAKKFARSLKGIGFNLAMPQCEVGGFRTGFWMTMEEYEELGKPTIGDQITMTLKMEK